MTLTPSYGRDYTKSKDAVADFEAGKDFTVASVDGPMGQQCSIRNFPGRTVKLRFNKNQSFVMVDVPS